MLGDADLSGAGDYTRESLHEHDNRIQESGAVLSSNQAVDLTSSLSKSPSTREAPELAQAEVKSVRDGLLNRSTPAAALSNGLAHHSQGKKQRPALGISKGAKDEKILQRLIGFLVRLGMSVQYTREVQVVAAFVLGIMCGVRMLGTWIPPLLGISIVEVCSSDLPGHFKIFLWP